VGARERPVRERPQARVMSTRLLKPDEAAEILGVPKSWVMDAARRDAIPHVRLGRYVRFDPDELERWWRRRAQGPKTNET
jgi:excisionase family DNA binding protein